MKNPFTSFVKWTQDIEQIETYKAEAYTAGADSAAAKFMTQHEKLIKKIGLLTQQNIDNEERIRKQADERVKRIEKSFEDNLEKTEQSLKDSLDVYRGQVEEERQRLRRRSNTLGDKIDKINELITRMLQHSTLIIDEQDGILKSAGRIKAHRNVLLNFEVEVKEVMQESAPLLSIEMNDGTEDKTGDKLSEHITDKPK